MMYERWRHVWANWPRVYRDLLVLGLICLGLYLVAIEVDAFDHFADFVATHEDWELDEIFSVLLLSVFSFTVFSWRRWQDLAAEVAERQRAEAALIATVRQLERSNRELQDFAYVASHDLQEPLRKIRAFGDRLKSQCAEALSTRGRDYLERMQQAAARMQTLIEDLLTFSRVTTKAQPFRSVDLDKVAREVVADLEVRLEQVNGRIDLAHLPTIEADPMQMRQLLQNLLGNVLKFSQPEPRPVVRLSSSSAPEPGGSPAANGSRTQYCQLLVEDNGIGFDEQYLDRIFVPFQRLHGRGEYEGTGIGLAICRKIAERHSGQITARSTPGQGATFIVTLPVSHPNGEHLA